MNATMLPTTAHTHVYLQYAHLYDNRIEVNTPIGICCGTATNDGCVVDNTNVYYFDRF